MPCNFNFRDNFSKYKYQGRIQTFKRGVPLWNCNFSLAISQRPKKKTSSPTENSCPSPQIPSQTIFPYLLTPHVACYTAPLNLLRIL